MTTPVFVLAGFSDDQRKVLSALAKGTTITAAAQSLGLHRNTIQYWCRQNPQFKTAVDNARQAYRASIQVEYEELADKALDTVKEILHDPKASASVRLRAALSVMKKIHEPMIELPPVAQTRRSAEPGRSPASAPEPTNAEIHAELTRIAQRWGMPLTERTK